MRDIKYFDLWFKKNPNNLFKEMTDHDSKELRSDVIDVLGIVKHADTVTSYLDMLRIGITPKYYTDLLEDYIKEYDKLKGLTIK